MIMTLRMRMMIMKQFENMIRTLEEAEYELDSVPNLLPIKVDINIAKNRVVTFRDKTVKQFEIKYKEKLKKLKAIRKAQKLN